MPTFGDVSSVEEHEQTQIDAAHTGYQSFLQGLDPAARAEQERRDREALEEQEGQEDARSEQMLNLFATQEARQEADVLGVDLGELRGRGSGDRGRIVVQDVRDHAEKEDE